MLVYNYLPTTKEYACQSEARRDPLNQNEYLIPANATSIEAPEALENQVAIFVDGEWEVKDDYRGGYMYNKTDQDKNMVDFIGEIPAEYTLEEPPDECCRWNESSESWELDLPIYLSTNKSRLKAKLADYRWSMTYGIVDELPPISYMNGFPIFHTLESRQRLELNTQALIRKGTPETETYRFKAVDGSWTDVLVGDILAWAEMFAETEQKMYEQEEAVQESIDALTTKAQLEALDTIQEFDDLVKPILSADLTKYSYAMKYHNEDA